MLKVTKTKLAQQDLINIWRYSYQNYGAKQADRYLEQLENAFKLLSSEPLICPLRHELSPPVRIYPVNKHLIIYTETDRNILIVRVVHESCDYEVQL